jgi:predicted nucleic-acid-binding Zn-ribbon protein
MESNAYGVRARKKAEEVTHTCSECGYSETL